MIRSIDDHYRAQLARYQAKVDAEAWLESRMLEIYTEDTRPENIMKTVADAIGRIYDRDCEGEMDAAIAAILSACRGSSNEAILSAAIGLSELIGKEIDAEAKRQAMKEMEGEDDE